MTAQIARDAYSLMQMTSHRPLRPVSADPKIERMSQVELEGKFDRDEQNLRRSRQGAVGGVQMTVQVAALGGDVLLLFWSLADGHQRRVLVTAGDLVYMDMGNGRAVKIGDNNKYAEPVRCILKARAH